jgi:hypothetical protein
LCFCERFVCLCTCDVHLAPGLAVIRHAPKSTSKSS